MIDNAFAIIILILMLAHFVATVVALFQYADILFGKGVKKDEK